MAVIDFEYLEKRAREEERLAAMSTHPAVRETRIQLAAAYRERIGTLQSAVATDATDQSGILGL